MKWKYSTVRDLVLQTRSITRRDRNSEKKLALKISMRPNVTRPVGSALSLIFSLIYHNLSTQTNSVSVSYP